MFSTLHLILIGLTIISVFVFNRLIIKGGNSQVSLIMKVIAVIIVFFDPAYWIWEYSTQGAFNTATTLPLYLCSLFWLLMPIAAFCKPGFLKQTALANIATVGLISGILGFIFNYHLNVHGIISFVGLRSLLYHYLMIQISVLLWMSDYYKPSHGDQIKAFIPVWIILIPGIILNRLYGYDYGYTDGGHGTPLILLSNNLPRVVFLIIIYLVFFLVVWGVFYRKVPLLNNNKNSVK